MTDGYLTVRNAKTAHGVIRYSHDPVVCVIDSAHAGRSVADLMPELARDVPIVGSLEEALPHEPTSLLLGVATPGGWMPDHWRPLILQAIEAGLEIVNGLHRMLGDDDEFARAARARGTRLWDVRNPPDDIALFSGKPLELDKGIVLTVGSDCAVGKKTTAIELALAGQEAGRSTEFVATGQTGILIAGKGIAVDRVISDFLPGAAERLVCDTDASTEIAIVEGQGSLCHPAYSAVTLGLLHGCCPEVLVLCHQAGREAIEEPPYTALPPLAELAALYESVAALVRPAKVACVSVNCSGLSEREAAAELARVEDDTGLPAGDVLKGGARKLWDAVAAALPSHQ